ncbi:MAG: ATP-dependent RNA helicase [Leucobacter sp.]
MTAHRFDLDRIGSGLPVAAAGVELERAAATGAMVVTAPPGTGKSTFVPPLVANLIADNTASGTVLLTQPRRVAVRAAATRIAELDGSTLGGAVGFTVRGARKVGPSTRIEALTPGVLLRRLIADPALAGVGAVILDEVHERSIESDLLLGMVAEVRALRDDLLVVAMSATLDATRIAGLLGAAAESGPAPIVDVPSALHPLDIGYAPFDGPRLDERGVTRGYLAHVASVSAAEQGARGCDALVFVPGAREVDEVVRLLRERVVDRVSPVEVLPLHGRIPAAAQDRAVRGRSGTASGGTRTATPDTSTDATGGTRDRPAARIVVSTALAESSLTVPGVRLVVDAGLAREVRRDRGRDMAGLVTVSASRASAEQRAGRAARQAPGHAVRVYSEADFARMPQASTPEIDSADLTDAALLLAAWGTPGGVGIALPSPPPAAAMRSAVEVLRTLELTDDAGHLTVLGSRVVRLPVGVREARALLAGASLLGSTTRGSKAFDGTALAAEIVAAVSDDYRETGAELPRLLRELRTGRHPGSQRWHREAKRLARLTGSIAAETSEAKNSGAKKSEARSSEVETSEKSGGHTEAHTLALREAAPGIIVALARPEWIARRTGEHARSYLFASGTRAALPEGSGLLSSEWIAVREVQLASGRAAAGTGAVIRLAAPLSEQDALRLGAPLLARDRFARVEGGKVRVREERRLGAILLKSTPATPSREDTGRAFAAHLRERGLAALDWSQSATQLRARLALLRRELGEPWPDVSDAALLERIGDWLEPDLDRLRPDASLRDIDAASALRRLLPWPEAARLDELVPERLAVPSGSTARIDYPEVNALSKIAADTDHGDASDDATDSDRDTGAGTGTNDNGDTAAEREAPPIVAVKLQEVFGLAESPRLVDGRVPILFHLLSPARRPLAITGDLASFWSGPYQQVRREMRGRYSKHPWPEDPWTAEATARTKRS